MYYFSLWCKEEIKYYHHNPLFTVNHKEASQPSPRQLSIPVIKKQCKYVLCTDGLQAQLQKIKKVVNFVFFKLSLDGKFLPEVILIHGQEDETLSFFLVKSEENDGL